MLKFSQSASRRCGRMDPPPRGVSRTVTLQEKKKKKALLL